MAIVCGYDFTDESRRVAGVASLLAARAGEELVLVHVLGPATDRIFFGGARDSLVAAANEALAREVARLVELSPIPGLHVDHRCLVGSPDEAIVAFASERHARLLVVGALGHRAAPVWRIGGTAVRIARSSSCPVLVLRDERSCLALEAWARGERPLHVTVGVDCSASADAALSWLPKLRQLGPLRVLLAHVYWPPGEYRRLGLRGAMPLVGGHEPVEGSLIQELTERAVAVGGDWEMQVRVAPGFGKAADHLLAMAEEVGTDLLVVGTHRREGLGRLWHGSVSLGVLEGASMSVVSVPTTAIEVARAVPIPRMRVVLAATDLSPQADRAIPYALSIVEPGGVVHVVHVADTVGGGALLEDQRLHLERAVAERVPAGITRDCLRIEILAGKDVAETISQHAERLCADAICLGSQGRTGLEAAVLGSVSQAVLARTTRPVLIVKTA